MEPIKGFSNFNIVYNYKNFSEILEQYEKEDKKYLLNNYLIYCFVYKKFDYIKFIITHFNLDINTILTFNDHQSLIFDISFVSFGVFCDDINFVKYLIGKKKEYIIDQDYCNYDGKHFKFNKVTPLFIAVSYTKNRDMIDYLIEYGADINARDAIDSTPIMKVDCYEKNIIEYYQFLISRGANINLQNKDGNTVLHNVIKNEKFNTALQLIHKFGANPFLFNNQKRDGLMEFIIYILNYYTPITDNDFDFWYHTKIYEYLENILEITTNPDLIYELFAACLTTNPYIKRIYFDKVKKSMILHNDSMSKYWRNNFNAIVGNDDDRNYNIKSVKVFNRLLYVYDFDTAIDFILRKILPFYEFRWPQYDKYIMLIIYVLDVVTVNLKSFKKLYGNVNIYAITFEKFYHFILRNFPNLIFEDIFDVYRNMMYKFMNDKDFLDDRLIYNIHVFIFRLYQNCFYDVIKRNKVKNYIIYEYPINLIDGENNSILHNIFKYEKQEMIKNFLLILLNCNNFKHLNLRNNKNQTPLQLAVLQNWHKDIIQLLLEYGSVILDLNNLRHKYHSLNVFENYVTLQNLTATAAKKKDYHYLPKMLQNFVDKF